MNGIILHVFCFVFFVVCLFIYIFFTVSQSFLFWAYIPSLYEWLYSDLWWMIQSWMHNQACCPTHGCTGRTYTCLIVLWFGKLIWHYYYTTRTLVRDWKTHKSHVIGSWVCHFVNHGLLYLVHSISIPELYSIYPIYGVLINIYFYIKLLACSVGAGLCGSVGASCYLFGCVTVWQFRVSWHRCL